MGPLPMHGEQPAALLELRRAANRARSRSRPAAGSRRRVPRPASRPKAGRTRPRHCAAPHAASASAARRGERRILLQRDHARRELAEHGGRIAGGAADIEHAVGRGDPGRLQQLGEHHRLEQRARRGASFTGTSRSRYAIALRAAGTNRSRATSSNAAMTRRSVTSLVRTWQSTMVRRACAKSTIASPPSRKPEEVRDLVRQRPAKRKVRAPRAGTRCAAASAALPLQPRSCMRGALPAGACSAEIPGHVAEWLRSGLQNRLRRFNSGRGLHSSSCL